MSQLKYVEFRKDKWRFIGRRANIVDAILGQQARGDSFTQLAQMLDLPVAAIEEASKFLEKNPQIIKEHEQRMLRLAKQWTKF